MEAEPPRGENRSVTHRFQSWASFSVVSSTEPTQAAGRGHESQLELSRRPEQRGQDHRGQPDHQPTMVLAYENRAQDRSDADDPAARDQAHHAAFQLRAAPLPAGHHALGALAPPTAALATASFARSVFGLGPRRGTLSGCATLAGLRGGQGLGLSLVSATSVRQAVQHDLDR